MPIEVSCDDCKKTYSVPEKMLGKRVKCKACGNVFVISKPQPVAVAEQEDNFDDGYEIKDDFNADGFASEEQGVYQPAQASAAPTASRFQLGTSLAGTGDLLSRIPRRYFPPIIILAVAAIGAIGGLFNPFLPVVVAAVFALFALLNLAIGTIVVTIRATRECGRGLDFIFVLLFFLTGIWGALLYAWLKTRGSGVRMGRRLGAVLVNSLCAAAGAAVLIHLFGNAAH